jgi:hypothetical protein
MAHLWDHRAILYRATPTRDTYGDLVEAWAAQAVPAGKNCRADQGWGGDLTDHGPGEQQSTNRVWFLDKAFADVRERDVLSITEGPETGSKVRILSVTRPTNPTSIHHFEITGEVWHGDLV